MRERDEGTERIVKYVTGKGRFVRKTKANSQIVLMNVVCSSHIGCPIKKPFTEPRNGFDSIIGEQD